MRDISGRHFDCVILDEAGQLTEPAALGPLLLGGSFIMVGDHFQLPPLVISEQAKRGGMDISLFKRLAEAHPDAVTWLDTQYRMNDDVMAIANTLEYDRKDRDSVVIYIQSYSVCTIQCVGTYQRSEIITLRNEILHSET